MGTNMFYYNLCCESAEEFSEMIFTHEEHLSDEEFEYMVHYSIKAAAPETWKYIVGECKVVNEMSNKEPVFPLTMSMRAVCNSTFFAKEMRNLGFSPLKSTAYASVFSASDIIKVSPDNCPFDKERSEWLEYTEDSQLKLQEEIRELIGDVEYPQ